MLIANHGGDIYSYEKDLLDYSSNINPLGFPEMLKEKIIDRFDEVLRYPDLEYRKLKKNLSKYLGVEKENIQVGNGAVEIIDQVISHFKRIILVEPSFSEYRLRAEVHRLDIVSVNLDENLEIDFEKLKSEILEGDLLLLANPNNPTGKTINREDLLDLYLYIVEKNAYLLLDEAFFEFANLDYNTIDLFRPLGFSNVGIIRAATKFFALPGIRLGYGVFDCDMLDLLKRRELPWSVNTFAVIASDYIFDKDFIFKSRGYLFEERKRFLFELEKIKGIYPYNTNSNYILLKVDNIAEDYLFRSLLEKNILVRRCSNYKNLKGCHIRIAIKTKEDNNNFLKILREIMED